MLALGILLLLFTFSLALGVAQNPGEFFRNQMAQTSAQSQGPSADFNYSGFDLNVTFRDASKPASSSITSWAWNFGDNATSQQPDPGHRFASYGAWQVSLTVTDANGQQSRTFGQLTVQPRAPISGSAVGNPFGGSGGVNLDLGVFLIPVGVGLLTTGMFLVLALVGGLITKAGWNLIKPKPETIRVRLKPRDLTRAFEDDASPAPAPSQGATPPPPPPA